VFIRIRGDRNYDEEAAATERPDEATIWAMSALLDPGELSSFTLALPTNITLAHLVPNPILAEPEHPMLSLPKLYSSVRRDISFLTTLFLNGETDTITDDTIMPLKWCTHLTVLWTRNSRVTDAGVKLQASALELESHRGMSRLRAWYLSGCKGISDRSMRSFARWPGLLLLGQRMTS
jgi:hypothetical protein